MLNCHQITIKIAWAKEKRDGINRALETRDAETSTKLKNELEAFRFQMIKLIMDRDLTPEERETGVTNFLGVEAVKTTFGVELATSQIPPLNFSLEELARARDLGQFLILRTNQIPGDKLYLPNVEETMKQPPKNCWVLVTKNLIKGTTNHNYWQQTTSLVRYLQEKVFPENMPADYQKAIADYDEYRKDTFKGLDSETINDLLLDSQEWWRYSEGISKLQINQLTRPTQDEIMYDLEVNFVVNKQYFLWDDFGWTSTCRPDGFLVSFASSKDKAFLGLNGAGARSDALGATFSRRS